MNLSVEEWDALIDAGKLNVWTEDDARALKTEVGQVRYRKSGPLTNHRSDRVLRQAINAILAYRLKDPGRNKPVVGPGSGQSWQG